MRRSLALAFAIVLATTTLLAGRALADGPDLPVDVDAFRRSAHGELSCFDCHAPRRATAEERADAAPLEAMYPSDPYAAASCLECHEREAREYREGIHWRALVKGEKGAPYCIDCHAPPRNPIVIGEAAADKTLPEIVAERGDPHRIPDSHGLHRSIPAERVDQVCARCHSSRPLAEKYGLNPDVVVTYEDSIHGRRAYLGSEKVPNCASCHLAHRTLEPQNPASPVNDANVRQTCAKCHENASQSFATAFRHERLGPGHEPALYWLEKGYVLLIVGVLGFLYSLVFLDFVTTIRLWLTGRLGHHGDEPLPPGTPREIERLGVNLRFQHVFMFLSTITLIVTGWPMKIQQPLLSRLIVDALGGADSVRWIHRFAAVVLIATLLWHFGYVLLRVVRRRADFSILPVPDDLKQVFQHYAFYLGLRKEPPRFGKFSYAQKMEYLAVVWGTLVMAASGLVLWSSDWAETLPGWVHTASRIVHGYEALLAAIAVFGVHFYNEHLRYHVFPMSRVWLTGKVPAAEYRAEWPGDFEKRFGKVEHSGGKEEE